MWRNLTSCHRASPAPLWSQKMSGVQAAGWGLGRVPCVQRRPPGTRCRYLPLHLSQHHHGNAGPAGCSSRHIPHHCSHHHCHLLTGGWGRGAAIFNQVVGRAQGPRCPPSPICQPLCLLSHPLPAELAAKHGVRGLSEGPSGVGEPAKGKSSGSARYGGCRVFCGH